MHIRETLLIETERKFKQPMKTTFKGNKNNTVSNFSPETVEARRFLNTFKSLKEYACQSRTGYCVKLFFKIMRKQRHFQKKTGVITRRSNQKKYLNVFFSQNKNNLKWKFADAERIESNVKEEIYG